MSEDIDLDLPNIEAAIFELIDLTHFKPEELINNSGAIKLSGYNKEVAEIAKDALKVIRYLLAENTQLEKHLKLYEKK